MQYIEIEGFRQGRESAVTAYFKYVDDAAKHPYDIHAFFEGRDDRSFYMNFLERFAADSKSVHVYECGNKKGVYEARDRIINGIRQGIVLFFVDQDLSDVLNEAWEQASDIYTTDYYSIENYLVSDAMLFRIWSELFRFRKETKLEFDKVHREKFHAELTHFYEYIRPIMAWIVFLRRRGLRPLADNISFTKFFDWDADLTLVQSKEWQDNGFKYLESVCKVQTPDSWGSEADAIIHELSVIAPKTYIRGKLELCFFVRFVNKFMEILHENLQKKGSGLTIKTPLTEDNAIEQLGPRSPIPPSLERFLLQHCVESHSH